ncbi:MAG: YicC family protein [Candidatus Omnitrophica bacterium]|nr:YicC family protein [Candidatus Omnitrophota bacterium]
MLTSMTGFGRSEVSLGSSGRAVVEIHTLNHRFLEVECRLPEGLQHLEDPIRKAVSQSIRRGRVRASLALKGITRRPPAVFETVIARQYVQSLKKLQRELKLSGPLSLETVLGLPQVVRVVQQDSSPVPWEGPLRQGVAKALAQTLQMRRREGQRLSLGLVRLVDTLESLEKKVISRLPAAQAELKEKFAKRIQDLAPSAGSSEAAAEAAALVQGTDVTEEISRLQSHLSALRQAALGRTENSGRTMEFLSQEIQREVNTLGSKLRDEKVIGWVVQMKNQIEKVREQAANIE